MVVPIKLILCGTNLFLVALKLILVPLKIILVPLKISIQHINNIASVSLESRIYNNNNKIDKGDQKSTEVNFKIQSQSRQMSGDTQLVNTHNLS